MPSEFDLFMDSMVDPFTHPFTSAFVCGNFGYESADDSLSHDCGPTLGSVFSVFSVVSFSALFSVSHLFEDVLRVLFFLCADTHDSFAASSHGFAPYADP